MADPGALEKFGSKENKGAENLRQPDSLNVAETAEFHHQVEQALPSEVISENASEDIGGGQGGAKYVGDDVQGGIGVGVRVTQLPAEKVMRKQVAKSIESEIRVLQKEVNRMKWPFAKFDADKYQRLVARIRSLGHVLAELAYATYDHVKGLWLKYVKNS